MTKRRFRLVWEEVATLSADYLQSSWQAFDGRQHTVQPDGFDVSGVEAVETIHDGASDRLTIIYNGHNGDPDRVVMRTAAIALKRQPCRIEGKDGQRVLFFAPCCGRVVRRLALLPQGVRCGGCGSITYRSKRKSGVQRIVAKADAIAGQLGCENWYGPITDRPKGMRRDKFERLARDHEDLCRQARAILQPRLLRASMRGPAAYWGAMIRAGM